jgi:hypothetical protein
MPACWLAGWLVGCPKQHRPAQKPRQAPKDGAEDDDNGDDGDMSGMALASIHPFGAGHSIPFLGHGCRRRHWLHQCRNKVEVTTDGESRVKQQSSLDRAMTYCTAGRGGPGLYSVSHATSSNCRGRGHRCRVPAQLEAAHGHDDGAEELRGVPDHRVPHVAQRPPGRRPVRRMLPEVCRRPRPLVSKHVV